MKSLSCMFSLALYGENGCLGHSVMRPATVARGHGCVHVRMEWQVNQDVKAVLVKVKHVIHR